MGTIRASASIMLTLKQENSSTPILALMLMAAVCARLAYHANQGYLLKKNKFLPQIKTDKVK
jgi:hypothetical protein